MVLRYYRVKYCTSNWERIPESFVCIIIYYFNRIIIEFNLLL
jgi:hypothetical protein